MPRRPLALLLLPALAAPAQAGDPLTPVPFQDVRLRDDFWGPRLATNTKVTVEANLRQCEVTGRIKNFAVAGKLESGSHQGALFNDSDVYKVIEGIAYTLANKRDPRLEQRTDAIIDKIAAALNLTDVNVRHVGDDIYLSGRRSPPSPGRGPG